MKPSLITHSVRLMFFLMAVDSACVAGALVAACYITCPSQLDFVAQVQSHLAYVPVFVVFWALAAARQQLFMSPRKDVLARQWLAVIKAAVVSLAMSGFVIAFFTSYGVEPVFVVSFGISALILIGITRTLLCMSLWTIHEKGYHTRRIILVGGNSRARHLVEALQRQKRYGYDIAGILEDDPDRTREFEALGIRRLGDFHALEDVISREVVDEVHVCLPVRSCYELIESIAHLCVGAGISVRLLADLFPLQLARSRIHSVSEIPMLSLSTAPESSWQLAVKRLTDIAVSLTMILALLPFFPILALLIKLDSPGPVFFLQERVGMNQRRFNMIKFRSMVVDAEAQRGDLEALNEADGPVFKIRNDPRITRVGQFLRKYSIDELPQIINVLKGEMSLVGPRPPIASEVAKYTWHQRRRLSVTPGMTGLWQVSGRSDLDFNQWVNLDLQYIDNWSIAQDFRILFRTFGVVVGGRGAA